MGMQPRQGRPEHGSELSSGLLPLLLVELGKHMAISRGHCGGGGLARAGQSVPLIILVACQCAVG